MTGEFDHAPHPVAIGELVLLHDPSDRPDDWHKNHGSNGYHWSIWQCVAHGYDIVVDWAGRWNRIDASNVNPTLDEKFIVIETHQPTLQALEMAAIHMKPGQWHTMLDRKYPWDEIDKSYGDNWRAYRR